MAVRAPQQLAALMNAAQAGHAAVVRVLVKLGADVAAADQNGWTTLMFAAGKGRVDAVRALAELGADVAARIGGE